MIILPILAIFNDGIMTMSTKKVKRLKKNKIVNIGKIVKMVKIANKFEAFNLASAVLHGVISFYEMSYGYFVEYRVRYKN